ncbi:hypothetical protein CI238_11551 [Colletotrichum incanum]|uniref:Uncharacterized protein n=1 Tax=Colletotrichum incanum TaxID=1573173 RepID=A0A166LKQ9_COLIC|nr:hypothetical protein CI238_11551 [Colletotrichum incanum]
MPSTGARWEPDLECTPAHIDHIIQKQPRFSIVSTATTVYCTSPVSVLVHSHAISNKTNTTSTHKFHDGQPTSQDPHHYPGSCQVPPCGHYCWHCLRCRHEHPLPAQDRVPDHGPLLRQVQEPTKRGRPPKSLRRRPRGPPQELVQYSGLVTLRGLERVLTHCWAF